MSPKAPLTVTLATTGRRTGLRREVTLYAFADGTSLVVVGSKGGAASDPAWAGNLRADARATLRRGPGREEGAVRAREVDGMERSRLWQLVTAAFPLYETYQRATERRIPLFALEPIGKRGTMIQPGGRPTG